MKRVQVSLRFRNMIPTQGNTAQFFNTICVMMEVSDVKDLLAAGAIKECHGSPKYAMDVENLPPSNK